METFPNEFLAQHVPLVFVAGINPAPTASAAPTSPLQPPADGEAPPSRPSLAPIATDPFEILATNLRRALAPKRPFALWDPARGKGADFHVVLVDKNIQFPPRKARPPPGSSAAPLHSPLSPLSPGSPVFPDGLIAPIWIRKHRELIPCIFILVLRLWEPPSLSHPLGNGPAERPPAELEEERRQDAALAQEIIERKRTTSERGMKLAVIIMTSRRMLDDPSLDPRLGALRRASGLDSRSSLFVLSPLGLPEVTQFVGSLKSELWESALDFYREHSRRVRRKRGRPSVTASSSAYVAQNLSTGPTPTPPLSQQGWHARSDFKLATFAEIRQEIEVALKHYEDAWEDLSVMFGSTAILPPRTKRWAEAKVLIDCINIKICKLYLYINDSGRALSRFQRHVARFNDLCNGWGIGDETFEFWSWLSKQYRLLGDLVDLACRNGFRLSAFLPPAPANLIEPPMRMVGGKMVPVQPGLVSMAGTFGLSTATILQHAGFYYFESAVCAEERREKFIAASDAEEVMRANAGESFTGSPALLHERKVNHAELIIELYTKAYEVFKKFSSNRMTLFLASRIAKVHHEASDHAMALRFFERIAKTYRREHCDEVLAGILLLAYESATKANAIANAVRLTFELLAAKSEVSLETRERVVRDLPAVLESAKPTEADTLPVVVDQTETAAFIDVIPAFWNGQATIGEAVPFQVLIPAPPGVPDTGFTFDSLRLHFSHGAVIVIDHDVEGTTATLQATDVGTVTTSNDTKSHANLTWLPESARIFRGTVAATEEFNVTLDTAVFQIARNGWVTEVSIRAGGDGPLLWMKTAGQDSAMLPVESLASECSFTSKRLAATVHLLHEPTALLDEHFPIVVRVANEDACDSDVTLSARIAGPAGSDDTLVLGHDDPAAVLSDVSLGRVSAGSVLEKKLVARLAGLVGERRMELVVSCKATDEASGLAPMEHISLVALPVNAPFLLDFDTTYVHRKSPKKTLLSFDERDPWADAALATFSASVQSQESTPLWLESLSLELEDIEHQIRVRSSSLPTSGRCDVAAALEPGELFVVSSQLDIANLQTEYPTLRPSLRLTWSRYPSTDDTPLSHTLVPLELPTPPSTSLIVTAKLPSHARLHTPCTISFSVNNPTAAVLDLALQLESSDQWLFSGPRKINRILLLPDTVRSFPLRAVPVAVGEVDVPRIRVFERVRQYVDPADPSEAVDDALGEGEEAPTPPPPQLRELDVVREYDIARPPLEGAPEVRATGAPLSIVVLP